MKDMTELKQKLHEPMSFMVIFCFLVCPKGIVIIIDLKQERSKHGGEYKVHICYRRRPFLTG